jgi:hypothetical protein
MTKRAYDTRPRAEILAAPHFTPYLEAHRLGEIGIRELRTLDAFFEWANRHKVQVPTVAEFLAFTADRSSSRRLENLRTALDRILPQGTAIQQTVRDAIREKKPRSRRCDRRSRSEIIAAVHFADYRHLGGLADIPLEHLRVLDLFLCFAATRHIQIPSVEDFLCFAGDKQSSRRLRSLKSALDVLLPGNPAVLLTLQDAIRQKSPVPVSKTPPTGRPEAEYRVPETVLPDDWQRVLAALRLGEDVAGMRPPATSTLRNMTDVLREYARIMVDAGLPVTITIDGLRRLEAARTARAVARTDPKYQDHGNRPATRHTAVQRIRMFAEYLCLEPLVVSAIRAHENQLRCKLAFVVPLKFGKLDDLPSLSETWQLAEGLLRKSNMSKRRQTKLRLLNEAVILALWTLLPLRLADGQLLWGVNIGWTGEGYQVDIDTQKADVPLRGRLHPNLTPFLDALILNGMDPVYLETMREIALAQGLPLFRGTTGKMLARTYPSKVWAAHMGTGAHISRARVHTDLGKLGPEGVEAALGLSAQSDPRSRKFYQGLAVAAAMMVRGQDMMEELLDESAAEN